MSTGSHDGVLSILDRLKKCTEQLSECGKDADLDVAALSLACKNGLEDLQRVLPIGLAALQATNENWARREEGLEIVEAFKTLESKVRDSLSILRKAMDRAEADMASLRGKRKAIRAYGHIGR